jgi:hypothetical protein
MSGKQSVSAIKQLYTEMIQAGGDFSKVPKSFHKQLKCFVKEAFPHFLVSDAFFYVPCYFTKGAILDFKQKFPNVSITSLEHKVIVITDWSLEMKRVNSSSVFTSYADMEIRLIVSGFKPMLNEQLNPTRYPVNLYRDDEMKTIIQQYRHQCHQRAAKGHSASLVDISKLQDKKKLDASGVVGGKDSDYTFKDGNTKVESLKDVYVMEHGKQALAKLSSKEEAAAPKVKGGVKRTKKAAAKAAGKAGASNVGKVVSKVMKYSPTKAKRDTPKGTLAKRSAVGLKKQTPALPSPGGKKSAPQTTDKVSMATFQKFLAWHEKKKSTGKGGKVLGKRSAGKAGKASAGKSSAKAAKK